MYEVEISARVTHAYDAFLSYNSRDRDQVEALARELEDAGGLSVWKDDWELSGGDNWMDALPAAIARSRALVAFIGESGIGPWHKTEIDIALKRAIETKTMRVIPVAITGCPKNVDLPAYLQMRQLVDLRTRSPWHQYLLRCAITGARPGRRDVFEESGGGASTNKHRGHGRLLLSSCKISNARISYLMVLRVANSRGLDSLVVESAMLRLHHVAAHPIRDSLPVYLAPIGRTRAPRAIQVPFRTGPVYTKFEQSRYLVPGEVEDLEIHIEVPPGIRALCSAGVLWSIPGESLARLTEVGYFTIGQPGTYSAGNCAYPPAERDSYTPGQQNLDPLIFQTRPEWPVGWPHTVSREGWKHYRAGETGAAISDETEH